MEQAITVYLAGPLFTQAEWQWNKLLASELRNLNLDIILPQETSQSMLSGTESFTAKRIFSNNLSDIERADVVIAILDQPDPDSGTCWECGYAYNLRIPIIGLLTDLRLLPNAPEGAASLNLMLEMSCKEILKIPSTNREDVVFIAAELAKIINTVPSKNSRT